MRVAWGWFVPGLGLGLWLGIWGTAFYYRRQRTIVCALCRAELPHQSNVSRHKTED